MGRYIKPIGGEFWYSEDIVSHNKNLTMGNEINDFVLLDGGQSAIEFILKDINLSMSDFVMVPSYLCPTILYKFNQLHINYLFYKINSKLQIDINDIKENITNYNVKAILFIDYFGFFHDDETLKFLKSLKKKEIFLIEDAVQMLWNKRLDKFIGDYIFNSYRKFFPTDGSFVITKNISSFDFTESQYSEIVQKARVNKTNYINNHLESQADYLHLFSKADKEYYQINHINGMSNVEKRYIMSIDFDLVSKLRINNYNYLHDKLALVEDIEILFSRKLIGENIPLTLPIRINNRDKVREKMKESLIFCPIHWDLSNESWTKKYPESVELSNTILSLPIDWRYCKKDMDLIIDNIIKILT